MIGAFFGTSACAASASLLDDCVQPDPLPPGAPLTEQLAYLKALSEYTRCLVEKGQGLAYPGICADIDLLMGVVEEAINEIRLPNDPSMLSEKPVNDLLDMSYQIEDHVELATQSLAQEPPDEVTAYRHLEWLQRWLGEEPNNTFRELADCP